MTTFVTGKPGEARGGFHATQAAAVLTGGLGIGWLTGLSASPVVAAVLASILGVAGGVIATLGDRESAPDVPVRDARPLALLILGVALGATGGVAARANDLLVFSRDSGQVEATETERLARSTLLFALPTEDECAHLLTMPSERLRNGFLTSAEQGLRRLGRRIEDPEVLRIIVEELCAD